MIVWVTILIIIALSIFSGRFARTTEDFFLNHTIMILLVAIGLLYWYYNRYKQD